MSEQRYLRACVRCGWAEVTADAAVNDGDNYLLNSLNIIETIAVFLFDCL